MIHPTAIHHYDDTGLIGAMVTIISGIASFALHGLPVVQFFAAVVAIVTGVLSSIKIIRGWRK